jgi:hypothetical protein
MNHTDIPTRFPVRFANAAGPSFVRTIPVDSQIGIQDGAASLTDGFPPDTFSPIASGGVPPFGQDFNGILRQLSEWARFQASGAPVTYDSDFATAIGGYPLGSRLASTSNPGVIWVSTADANTTDPDGGSAANWRREAPVTSHLAAEGYRIGSDGFIEQWGGAIAGSDGTTTIDLTVSPHIPFPTACLNLVVSNNGSTPVAWAGGVIVNRSTLKIGQVSSSATPAPGAAAFWRAIGY